MQRAILLIVVVVFPVSEIALTVFRRAGTRAVSARYIGSNGFLWVVIGASVSIAVALQWVAAAVIHASAFALELTALVFTVVGLVVRWTAIRTLGRFFTVEVAIQTDHHVVDTGVYKHIRHPSYAGLLLVFLGLGVASANWLSLAALVLPVTAAFIVRIVIEERILRKALGAPYDAYCSRTKRLVPGVY